MTNTKRVHERFWQGMASRYGRRWTDNYGADPSDTWRKLIDRFTPEEIRVAMDGLGKVSPEHPPTLPQFETLLDRAASVQRRPDVNERRNYWRSVIVHDVGRGLGHTFFSLEPVIVMNRETLGYAMLSLLDEMEQMELRAGLRTEHMEQHCCRKCDEIATTYQHLAGSHWPIIQPSSLPNRPAKRVVKEESDAPF